MTSDEVGDSDDSHRAAGVARHRLQRSTTYLDSSHQAESVSICNIIRRRRLSRQRRHHQFHQSAGGGAMHMGFQYLAHATRLGFQR